MQRLIHRVFVRVISFCFLLCMGTGAMAIDERYGAPPLKGNQLATDSTSTVTDTVYFNPGLKPIQTTYSVRNLMTLQIDESYLGVLPDAFDARVYFNVQYTYDNNGTPTVVNTSQPYYLELTYVKDNFYFNKQTFRQTGWHKVVITIVSVTAKDGSPLNAAARAALMLTNDIEVVREYNFSCTGNAIETIFSDAAPVASKGELKVFWDTERAADEYDLEWTYIDNDALPNYYKPSTTNPDPKKIFAHNATRVSIQKEDYLIPLLYEGKGHLFYRVRAVQVKQSRQRIESSWSSDYTNGLGRYDHDGLDTTLNWQASTSFAEEGKRKSVVQYYDGALKSRQTVTKDNTTDTTVVAETFYDYQGRPVIQVMPTPSLNSMIKYTSKFNRVTGDEYLKDHYDGLWKDSCFCTEGAPAMDSGYGAAKYYSANNPLVNSGIHRYIPRAKGFAFAETRYTPDNTSRISMQGGVSDTFQIGKGHATAYTYSSADQEELDALFGTDVGDASHYFKNTVRDANGQYSISYVDMHGRTIATALAGTPPVKVDPLSSNIPQRIVKQLLDSQSNVIKGTAIESSKGLVVTRAGDHQFKYSLLPDSITINDCNTIPICYDCIYDLEITITDECNNTSFTNRQPIVITRKNYQGLPTIDCNAPALLPVVDTSVYLLEGSYLVTKTLTINNKAMEYYRDEVFMVRNTCQTLEQAIQEQKQLLQQKISCAPASCDTCTAQLGTWEVFRHNYMTDAGIAVGDTVNWRLQAQTAYNQKIEECNILCNESGLDKSFRQQMLADITPPYGQYANPDDIDEYSVFYSSEVAAAPYRTVSNQYKTELGQNEPIDPRLFEPDHFSDQFKTSWAETLLEKHPEYAKLQKFEEMAASHAWDLKFEKCDTYQEAVSRGFLNPAGFSVVPAGSNFNDNPAYWDPFFTNLISTGVVEPGYRVWMQDTLVRKADYESGSVISMWSLATIMAHCPPNDASCINQYQPLNAAFTIGAGCTGDLDMAWRYFRELYLQEKREMIAQILRAYQLEHGNPASLGNLALNHFVNFYDPYLVPTGDIPQSETVARDSLNAYIDYACKGYVQQWWNELKPCGYDSNDSLALIPLLIQVCKEGGDEDHVFGASSVKPASTNTYRSFEEVLKAYNAAHNKPYNSACNVFLISAPKSYDKQPVYYDKPVYQKPTDCECETISNLYQRYQDGGTDTSFAAFVYRATGTRVYQGVLDTLRMACAGDINCSFLKEPLVLPPALQCGVKDVCVDCEQFKYQDAQFKLEFPGVFPAATGNVVPDSVQQSWNLLYEKYMSIKLGFAKTTADYMQFLDECKGIVSTPSCDSLAHILSDFRNSYYPPAAPGCNTAHFTMSRAYGNFPLPPDWTAQIYSGGTAHIPPGLLAFPLDATGKIPIGYHKNDTLCVNNDFTIKARIRLPFQQNTGDFGTTNLVFWGDNISFSPTFTQYNPAYDTAACIQYNGYQLIQNGSEVFPRSLVSMLRSFAEWRVITIKAHNNVFQTYVDDTLVLTVPYTVPVNRITAMATGFNGTAGQTDWIRVYDATGQLQYSEEYEDCKQSPSNYPALFQCPRSGCETAFVNYFNSTRGTSYTSSQIAELYKSCGIVLDACPDTSRNGLMQVKEEFINHYFNNGIKYDSHGCDTTSWKFDFGGWYNNLNVPNKDLFSNGALQFPDTLSLAYGHRAVTYDFYQPRVAPLYGHDSACIDNYVNVEFRMYDNRLPGSTSHTDIFTLYFGHYVAKQYIISLDQINNVWNYVHMGTGYGSDEVIGSISEFQQNYNGWHTLNFEVKDNIFNYYLDGVLIKSLTFTNIQREKFYGFSMQSRRDGNMSAKFDYVKCYDRNGKVFYFEDFNDCGKMARFEPYIRCPKPCAQAFTDFYNQKKQTNLNYSDIETLYASHNVTLNVCGDSVDMANCTFQKTYGGSGTDVVNDMVRTKDNGYIMAGQTNSFGNGGMDGYVIKTNEKGALQWSKTYGGSNEDIFYKIRQTFDGGYIAAGSTRSFHQNQREVFVVKMDANGNVIWSKGFNQGTTNGELAYDVIQTTDSGYVVQGMYNYNSGVSDWEMIRLSAAGDVVWAKRYGTNSSDDGGNILEDNDTLVLTGCFYASTLGNPDTYYDGLLLKVNKSNGNIIWSKTYNVETPWSSRFTRIYATPGGYDILSINANGWVDESVRNAIVQVNKGGDVVRIKLLQTPAGRTRGNTLYPTADGGYVSTQSEFNNTGDVYWHKSDASGNLQWTNRIRRNGEQHVYASVQLPGGGYVGAGSDGSDGMLMKVSATGTVGCGDTSLAYTNSNLPFIIYDRTLPVNNALTFSNNNITVTAVNAATSVNVPCITGNCYVEPGPMLCGRSEPVFPPVTWEDYTPCADTTQFAFATGTLLHEYYSDSLLSSFSDRYLAKCLGARYHETFTVDQPVSEFHYTLYYYDQAGNLVQTVPPQGVDISKFGHIEEWSDSVKVARRSKVDLTPGHGLVTGYRYNTLNKIITSNTPDGGLAEFWYDRMGRMAINRNAKQKAASTSEIGRQYSYTIYDVLGRISEIGQLSNATGIEMTDVISRSSASLGGWMSNSAINKEQITQRVYDMPYGGFAGISPTPIIQHNLRNRVSYTTFTTGNNPAQYDQGSFFSYDMHGNLDTLLQDYGSPSNLPNIMNTHNMRFKTFVYHFDLISRKVNRLEYQPNYTDGWIQRYTFDAEDRLTQVETSSDGLEWETDAEYRYYQHGPLARVVIGNQQVQGMDYVYTLQNWLKGVNSIALDSARDMGNDGFLGGQNQYVARDVNGFSLNYFTDDYKPINISADPFPNYSDALPPGAYKPLYNGNIGSIGKSNAKLAEFDWSHGGTMFYNYSYDQLNRLTKMDAYNGFNTIGNNWSGNGSGLNQLEFWKERIAYDGNGNILKYKRNGAGGGFPNEMDSLSYKYYPGTNRLKQVRDSLPTGAYPNLDYFSDLDDQPDSNYVYDEIGNLVKDSSEKISNITWNKNGKLLEINKEATSPSAATRILFTYDAQGKRLSKTTEYAGSNVKHLDWYVRDAQGNVMAVYSANGSMTADYNAMTTTVSEWHIYGSSLLGTYNNPQGVNLGPNQVSSVNVFNYTRGLRRYHITNHLENVEAVITDKKYGVPSTANSSLIAYFKPDITLVQDFYPFGWPMPGRTWQTQLHRYGFNGKEVDNEVKGRWNQQDYGMRIYDPRVGRFLSVDPITNQYPELTPYQFASDNPIQNIDIDGLEGGAANGAPTLYHVTTPGAAEAIIKGGFNATEKGKYSNYNWFSTKSGADGTGVGFDAEKNVELKVKGLETKDAHTITKSKVEEIESAARKSLSKDFGEFQSLDDAKEGLSSNKYNAYKRRFYGVKYRLLGEYMDANKKSVYFLETEGSYAFSDKYLKAKFQVWGIKGKLAGTLAKTVNGLKYAGKTLVVVGVAMDVYEIATSENVAKTITKKAGSWAGAALGAKGGAAAGAWFGGWGAIPGAIVGGIVGYKAGEYISETVYETMETKGWVPSGKE